MRKWIFLSVFLVIVAPNFTLAEEAGKEMGTELDHTVSEDSEEDVWAMLSDRIVWSVLLEVEGLWEDSDGERNSEILLSTLQFGLKYLIKDEISLLVAAQWEDQEHFEFDEAILRYDAQPWNLILGLQNVTFGSYPSRFISGPLTEDLGETKETAILVFFSPEGLEMSAWAANGDTDKAGKKDRIDDYGFSLSVTAAGDLELGASFISDISDTDAMLTDSSYTRRVPGMGAFFIFPLGDLEFAGEYVTTSRKFSPSDLDENGDNVGDSPAAWNTEIAVELLEDMELAIRIGGSSEFADAPEIQEGFCLSYGIVDWMNLSLEYLHEEFDTAFSQDLERDAVTAQVAVQF